MGRFLRSRRERSERRSVRRSLRSVRGLDSRGTAASPRAPALQSWLDAKVSWCIIHAMRMPGNCTRILGGPFILSLALSAQTLTTLYNFSSQDYGAGPPHSGVILGPQGELYGTTYGGGRWNQGTVYELLPPDPAGGAWTEVVLHSFGKDPGGAGPTAGLTIGPNGTLYGATPSAAFRLDPPAGTATEWAFAVIWQCATGSSLSGGLAFGSPLGYGQSLYGATMPYGGGLLETGSVFKLTAPAAAGGAWTETALETFSGGTSGGAPVGMLAAGAGGALFGVTSVGGYVGGGCGEYAGCGTVFSLTPPAQAGGPWTEQVLHSFNPLMGDGQGPGAGVVIGPGGVLYGTTAEGGEYGFGTVYSLTPPTVAGAPMTETILYSFTGLCYQCIGPVVLGPNGVLYGETNVGRPSNAGIVFELTPPATTGGTWTRTNLHIFTGPDGAGPNALTLAPDGTLYGTTAGDGTSGHGTVFALTP